MQILVVCSANQCRSPMGAALLQARLDERGSQAVVRSAGFGPSGWPALADAVAVMAEIGIDLGPHRSEEISRTRGAQSDLIIGMTRQHVIDLVVLDRDAWPRTFPLVDLVRRGGRIGPRPGPERPADWVRRVHQGRRPSSVLALATADDIVDPVDQPRAAFQRTRDDLARLTADLARLLVPDDSRPTPTQWSGWAS